MKSKTDISHRIVSYLLDNLEVTSRERGIDITPYKIEELKDIDDDVIFFFLQKLVDDYKVASVVHAPYGYEPSNPDEPYPWSIDDPTATLTVILNENFQTWAEDFLKRDSSSYPVEITFSKNREILLNKLFLIGKPDFDSENELVFGYLYNNPNKRLSQAEIEEALNAKINKSFHKIIENLGFKGDLKHIFFQVSKNTILFRNPVTSEELKSLGYTRIKLS